mmetsp:Transcript_3156/g.4628  ORF Transcript_3156/g.4628 Transcript_3156/m.4628 type:complete len:132 (+) Transcript_3156:1018-1413(+)
MPRNYSYTMGICYGELQKNQKINKNIPRSSSHHDHNDDSDGDDDGEREKDWQGACCFIGFLCFYLLARSTWCALGSYNRRCESNHAVCFLSPQLLQCVNEKPSCLLLIWCSTKFFYILRTIYVLHNDKLRF